MRRLLWLLPLPACAPPSDAACDEGPVRAAALEGIALEQPCAIEIAAPTRLLVTTTDFATGAVAVVDLATATVTRDVAAATTDSIPAWHDGAALLLNRYQYDSVTVLDPDRGFALAGEHAVAAACSDAPNPQAVVFDPDGHGWVTQLDVPTLAPLSLASDDDAREPIDLRAVPDADGNPDAGLAFACGPLGFVAVQRLDPSYGRVGPDELVAVDLVGGQVLDRDPDRAGAQGLPAAGAWLRQLRADPTDAHGHTVLALSTGIERFALDAGTVSWAVAPERFAAVALGGPRQLQAFDVDDTGTLAYVAAYAEDFSAVSLWRVGLDDAAPQQPERFADGFDSVEHTLELVDQRLWYGSTRRDAPGLWQFDVAGAVPEPLGDPLSTGLPPYSMVAIP
ncbi:MAG: hypothetical protein K1X88_00390 [Nannocystaceae bacterium]|nr:hypothetical protein [Nannocystaceae bacterium]